MAFNKTKAMESALKALNQGKVAQAIQEYQMILRNDSKDQVILMTVGDLFVRQGNMPQAVEYFERLADLYLHDGFNSKAIAIYKKISKLAPNETQPMEKLANLYVQQGILSEARPIFLQLAESHLKANQTAKAVELLRRLIEVEPDNPRVQRRLAELYLAIGQKKEAAQTYLTFARYLQEHGESKEALDMVDAALGAVPGDTTAVTLKAKILGHTGQTDAAIAALKKLPDSEASPEAQALQVDLCLKGGQVERAAELVREAHAQGEAKFPLVLRVADALVDTGDARQALEFIGEFREPAIVAGEKDRVIELLNKAAEKLKGPVEPYEWLADIYRRAGDTYHLSETQVLLADALINAGKAARAEEVLSELLEHEPDNEVARQRLQQLRKDMGQATAAPAVPAEQSTGVTTLEPLGASGPAAPPAPFEQGLDDDTQRYIAQALTDVDLLSSYGLTQKAIQLLDSILQRVPRHAPTLERLLDLSLGAGDDRRTAELAAQLEQIYLQREDLKSAERFTELRRRFQRASGATDEEISAAQASVAAPPAPPAEFEVPIEAEEAPAPAKVEPEAAPEPVASAAPTAPAEHHEIDLTEEWAKMSEEVGEEPAAEEPKVEASEPEAAPASTEEHEAESADFDLELVSEAGEGGGEAASSQSFLDELVAEIEGMEAPAAEPKEKEKKKAKPQPEAAKPAPHEVPQPTAQKAAPPKRAPEPAPVAPEPVVAHAAEESQPEVATGKSKTAGAGGGNNDLSEVFQEFRAELGEMGEEEEDLETHYNLGIAYREMGLLDEAIGEFQKVAKSIQAGRPFRYAMQCSTFLGLTFIDKQEPKIAAMWYQRALETPGLDQETILALRYDLGLAEAQAGDAKAALQSFRQVYAVNIDYRDVAERIAELQKR